MLRTIISRLSVATISITAVVASCAAAQAAKYARYYFNGEPMPEPTAMETVSSWAEPVTMVVIIIAFFLPGMTMNVFLPFAALALYFGWQFAICLCFGYYLLQWLIGGANAYD